MEGLFCCILWGVSNFKFLQKTGGYAISCPQFNRREQALALQYGKHFAGVHKKVGEDMESALLYVSRPTFCIFTSKKREADSLPYKSSISNFCLPTQTLRGRRGGWKVV